MSGNTFGKAYYNQNYVYSNDDLNGKVADCMLVAHIPLNGHFCDIKGTSHGTVTGTVTPFVKAPMFNGVCFPGTCDYITLANEMCFDFDFNSTFSISLWVKHDVLGSADVWIAKRSTGAACSTGWSLQKSSGDNTRIEFSNGTCEFGQTYACLCFTDLAWHHVAFTYNGMCNLNNGTAYLDGVSQVGSSVPLTGSMLNCCGVSIGATATGVSDFNGQMADVRIWNSVITACQVTQLYNKGKHRSLGIADPCLVAAIQFDNNVECYVGNSHCGTWVMCAAYTDSPFYMAGLFDETNGVTLAGECAFDFTCTTPFSVSLWLYPTATCTNFRHPITKFCNYGTLGWGIFHQMCIAPNRVGFNMANCVGTCFGVNSASCSVPFCQWTHVVGTFDGSMCNDGFRIYINGTLNATGVTNAMSGTFTNNVDVRISGDANNTNEWAGRIDDVRIYSRELSASEVQTLFERR